MIRRNGYASRLTRRAGVSRINPRHPLAGRWTTLYNLMDPLTHTGTGGSNLLNIANTAVGGFPEGALGYYDTNVWGPSIYFNPDIPQRLAGSAAASSGPAIWNPFTLGFLPVAIFVVFNRISGDTGGAIYGFSSTNASGFGLPALRIYHDGTNVGAQHGVGFPTYPEFTATNPIGINETCCAVFTSRSTTDHELGVYSLDSNDYVAATATTSMSASRNDVPTECIAISKRNGAFFSPTRIQVLMCGFSYTGFASDEVRLLATDPFALLDPESGVPWPAVASSLTRRPRVMWFD